MAYIGAGQNTYTVFPLENYTFGNKAPKMEKQRGVEARFKHLKEKYAEEGTRRTVEGVALVHKHRTLHVLLLQLNPNFFKLPGGRLKLAEDEIAGMQRKLTRHLAPEHEAELQMRWQIADCLGRFYRPNFETLLYPYCPAHIERPKETKKIFLVNLPEKAFLTVPRNMKLVAVPLFELHDHVSRYGHVISALPALLSRLHFNLSQPSGSRVPVPKPVEPDADAPAAAAAAQADPQGLQWQQQQQEQQQALQAAGVIPDTNAAPQESPWVSGGMHWQGQMQPPPLFAPPQHF